MNVRDMLYNMVTIDSDIDDLRISLEEDDSPLANDVILSELLEILAVASDAVIHHLQNKERV